MAMKELHGLIRLKMEQVIICRASSASILFKVFGSWRDKFGMTWEYKPALTTEEFVSLIKEK